MSEWFENAAFWEEMAPWLFDPSRMERAVSEVDGVVKLLGIEPPARLLDLGCGPGRHSIELAARGFQVTGVDLHALYLERARARAPEVEWVHQDMRHFVRPGGVSAALSFFSSFGYFEDASDDARVAGNLFTTLEPGGALLIETQGKETLARRYQPRRWHEGPDGALLLERVEIAPSWSSVQTTWIALHGDVRREHQFRMRLYSGVELEGLLRATGFGRVDLFGGLDGRPYDAEANRLIAVARRE